MRTGSSCTLACAHTADKCIHVRATVRRNSPSRSSSRASLFFCVTHSHPRVFFSRDLSRTSCHTGASRAAAFSFLRRAAKPRRVRPDDRTLRRSAGKLVRDSRTQRKESRTIFLVIARIALDCRDERIRRT